MIICLLSTWSTRSIAEEIENEDIDLPLDLVLKKGQMAPFDGVLIEEQAYRNDQNEIDQFRRLQESDMFHVEHSPSGNGLMWFLSGVGAGILTITLIHQK